MSSGTLEAAGYFELIKEGVLDYGIVFTDRRGVIIDWNAGAERLFGYREAEVFGQPLALIFMAEDRESRQPESEMEMAAESGRSEDDRVHRRKDGSSFVASGVLTALRDKRGHLCGFVKVVRDVTAKMDAERAFEQARRNQTLAVLAGGFAHDFNNLLTSILGNTSFVLDQLAPSSPFRAPLEAAAASSQQAADLTRRLLAYAGRGQFVVQRLNLSRFADELRPAAQSSSHGVPLEYKLAENLPDTKGDPSQIQQLILDLIANAGESMANRPGTIVIATGVSRLNAAELKKLESAEAQPGEFVFFEVADRGTGMDENTRLRMFEPFFSTKFVGRGLGLASVSGTVRKHKGAMRVTTQLGVGTTVRVYLPVFENLKQ